MCLYRKGLEDVVRKGVVPCNGGVADLDRIHRQTDAIPASREARNSPALTSSLIVSDQLPGVLCRRDKEDVVVVVVIVEEEDAVARDGTTILQLLLFPPPLL